LSAHAVVLALLQARPDLVALVGQRITPDQLDDPPVYPAVTFQKIDGGGARGALTNPGLMWAMFQVTSWASPAAGGRVVAEQMAAAVRKAIDRKRKTTIAGMRVDDCFYQSDLDADDPDTGVCCNHAVFKIHYRDTP
jgi:hypothetical protein